MSHFKLMIDETYGQPVADEVNKISGKVAATTTFEQGFEQETPDEVLIRHGKEKNLILLTHDHNTIDEYTYPPCAHGGIIIVKDKNWFKETISASLKALRMSGKAGLVHHHVTYLFRNRAIIHTHDPEPVTVTF